MADANTLLPYKKAHRGTFPQALQIILPTFRTPELFSGLFLQSLSCPLTLHNSQVEVC